MQTIRIELAERSYPILIGRDTHGLFETLPSFFDEGSALLVTSPTVLKKCLTPLKKEIPFFSSLPVIILPDGERFKIWTTVSRLIRELLRCKADRKTVLLILGGGVLGDLAGFGAATYLRGIPYLQIPTTLVAQIDSAIGGKVGVNLSQGKNLVGAFYQPRTVFTSVAFLKTLPPREFRSGLAEAVKCGLIRDPALYDLLLEKKDRLLAMNLDLLEEIVGRAARVKANVVGQDERETTGFRRILNFGHTFGHALERLTRYRRYRHGEAVAIGMALATRLSAQRGYLEAATAERIIKNLAALGLPTVPPSFSPKSWGQAIEVDKKREQGMIQFVFLKGIGEVTTEPIEVRELTRHL